MGHSRRHLSHDRQLRRPNQVLTGAFEILHHLPKSLGQLADLAAARRGKLRRRPLPREVPAKVGQLQDGTGNPRGDEERTPDRNHSSAGQQQEERESYLPDRRKGLGCGLNHQRRPAKSLEALVSSGVRVSDQDFVHPQGTATGCHDSLAAPAPQAARRGAHDSAANRVAGEGRRPQ